MAGRIISIWGEPWTLKTTLGVSSIEHIEGDLVVFDLDKRLDPVLPHFKKCAKRIKVVNCPIPASMGVEEFAPKVKGDADSIFKKLAGTFKKACESDLVGGIMLDTSTIFYQIARERRMLEVAEEAKSKGETRKTLNKFEYAPINLWLKGAYSYAKDHGKTLILISHARPIYDESDNETGEFQSDSWSKTLATADVEVQSIRTGDKVVLLVHKNGYALSCTKAALPCTWETIEELCQGKHTAKTKQPSR